MADSLVLEGITKRFPGGIVANDDISFRIRQGEIRALLGENGAGKSTLMKMLYGVYRPDAGTISVDGKQVDIESPRHARQVGIGMVFQTFMLIPAFTVIENVALGLQSLGVLVNGSTIEAKILEISNKYSFGIDPHAPVWQLSMGAQQKVEIIKLLLGGARLLIFDEPTSVLAPHEAEGLFDIFRALRANGYTIIFISHKLNEVLSCADEITVLRRGRVVGSIARSDATEDSLVAMIVGSRTVLGRSYEHPEVQAAPTPVLELRDVSAQDERGRMILHGVNLAIAAGEILGVAGVSGNGQKELGEVIQGIRPASGGQILVGGKATNGWSVARIRAAGVTCIPEDPLTMGAVRAMTVQENLALGDGGASSGPRWRGMNWSAARAKSAWLTERFQLRMPPLAARIETLSGGNVQRVLCAREMAGQPALLLAYYPTRGMDIQAAHMLRSALMQCRNDGSALLVISEDLDELLALSDRIVVLFQGQTVGETVPAKAALHELGRLMTDGKQVAA